MQVVLLSHGNFATEILKSAEMILGPLPAFEAVNLQPSEGPEQFRARLEKIIDSTNSHHLIIVDILGGTPSNVALKLMAENKSLRVISGLNLPMLIEIANKMLLKKEPTNEEVIGAGTNGITDVRTIVDTLRGSEEDEE